VSGGFILPRKASGASNPHPLILSLHFKAARPFVRNRPGTSILKYSEAERQSREKGLESGLDFSPIKDYFELRDALYIYSLLLTELVLPIQHAKTIAN
jgi:hypothetical protein